MAACGFSRVSSLGPWDRNRQKKESEMLLKLTHTTDLTYSDLISESVMELRMAPRQEQDQHRLSFDLAIGPRTHVTSYFDWLQNTVHTFTIGSFHKQIRIVATSVVETDRPRKEVHKFADTWPFNIGDDYALYDYVHFSGPVMDSAQLQELVSVLQAVPGASLGELALRMLHLIADRFAYSTGFTTAASPISDVLQTGKGRDYRDVPPNKGRWQATGAVKEAIEVTVRSEELKAMPPELAAERMLSISVPVYPGGSAIHREMAEHQVEVQQQQ
jgi:hypothetical protein